MSILDKAKEYAEASKSEHQKELDRHAKQLRDRAELCLKTRVEVQSLLARELNGQMGFTVDFTTTQGNGCLAVLQRNKQACGFVCVNGQDFTYDGSDECRDIPGWGIKVELKVIPTSDRVLASNVGGYIGHNQSLEDGIRAFADSLAQHLKRYF